MPTTLPVSFTTVSLMQMTLPAISSISNLTSAQVALYAGQAQAVVEAKISKHYSLPFTSEVPLLQTLTTDIALYYILAKRIFTSERMNKSDWPDRYKEALTLLDEVAAGKLALLDSSGAIVGARNDQAEMWSNNKDYVPVFHDGPWEDQVQDPNMLDDIQADREF